MHMKPMNTYILSQNCTKEENCTISFWNVRITHSFANRTIHTAHTHTHTHTHTDAPFRERETKHLIKQICIALRECHKAGIAHLDIKPENIVRRVRARSARISTFFFTYSESYHLHNSYPSHFLVFPAHNNNTT